MTAPASEREGWWWLSWIEGQYDVVLSEHGALHGDTPATLLAELRERAQANHATASEDPKVLAQILADLPAPAIPNHAVTRADEVYPNALHEHPCAPYCLFWRGDPALLADVPRVGIVGSRRARPAARAATRELAADLARSGTCVVSGLALGIDGEAHRGALAAGGSTIAVIPAGLDHIVPRRHAGLAEEILDSGGLLVSPYIDHRRPERWQFAARNKVVVGLSDCIVVGQAAHRSGTLVTVDEAVAMGVAVGVLPGALDDPAYAGSAQLMRDGCWPVLTAAHVFDLADRDPPPRPEPSHGAGTVLTEALRTPRSAADIAALVGSSEAEAARQLTLAELRREVVRDSAGRYMLPGNGPDGQAGRVRRGPGA